MALIAAANYGFSNSDLDAAVAANEDDAGPAPGAKLLLARSGEAPDDKLIELAFTTKTRQPKVVRSPSHQLIYGYMLTPCRPCLRGVGVWGYSDHLSFLHQALEHKDIRTQIEAARALEKIADAESAPFLSQRLERCEWLRLPSNGKGPHPLPQ